MLLSASLSVVATANCGVVSLPPFISHLPQQPRAPSYIPPPYPDNEYTPPSHSSLSPSLSICRERDELLVKCYSAICPHRCFICEKNEKMSPKSSMLYTGSTYTSYGLACMEGAITTLCAPSGNAKAGGRCEQPVSILRAPRRGIYGVLCRLFG